MECVEGTRRAFVTDTESAEVVEPGERSLDNPADLAETTSMNLVLWSRQNRLHSALSRRQYVLSPAIGTVSDKLPGAKAWTAKRALYGRNGNEQLDRSSSALRLAAEVGSVTAMPLRPPFSGSAGKTLDWRKSSRLGSISQSRSSGRSWQ
jgi:hypothetical protein